VADTALQDIIAPAVDRQALVEEELERQSRRDEHLLGLIRQVRDIFENHFDRTWFSVIIDGLPIDFRTVREIREMVGLRTIYPGEEWEIYQGVLELETFVLTVRRQLLPVLRERLGISWLFPGRRVRDRNQALLRRLVAITFPYNLERLRLARREGRPAGRPSPPRRGVTARPCGASDSIDLRDRRKVEGGDAGEETFEERTEARDGRRGSGAAEAVRPGGVRGGARTAARSRPRGGGRPVDRAGHLPLHQPDRGRAEHRPAAPPAR
jgi:hypothetical protein